MATKLQEKVFSLQIKALKTKDAMEVFFSKHQGFLEEKENVVLATLLAQAYDNACTKERQEDLAKSAKKSEAEDRQAGYKPPLKLWQVIEKLPKLLGGIFVANCEVLRNVGQYVRQEDITGLVIVLEAIPQHPELFGRIKFFFDSMAEMITAIVLCKIAEKGERITIPEAGKMAIRRMIKSGRLPDAIVANPRVNMETLRISRMPASTLLAMLQKH
jgi:hypothetical protein